MNFLMKTELLVSIWKRRRRRRRRSCCYGFSWKVRTYSTLHWMPSITMVPVQRLLCALRLLWATGTLINTVIFGFFCGDTLASWCRSPSNFCWNEMTIDHAFVVWRWWWLLFCRLHSFVLSFAMFSKRFSICIFSNGWAMVSDTTIGEMSSLSMKHWTMLLLMLLRVASIFRFCWVCRFLLILSSPNALRSELRSLSSVFVGVDPVAAGYSWVESLLGLK